VITRAECDEATAEAPWSAEHDETADGLIDEAEYRKGICERWGVDGNGVITENAADLQM